MGTKSHMVVLFAGVCVPVLHRVPSQRSIAQPPSEVTGRPVDEIINEWNAELEQRSRSFVKHAEALAKVGWHARGDSP